MDVGTQGDAPVTNQAVRGDGLEQRPRPGDQRWQLILQSRGEVGEYGLAQDKLASRMMRELMEERRTMAMKAFSDCPPTYYGYDGGVAHIGQIVQPDGCGKASFSTRAMGEEGRVPQLMKHHLP